MDVVRQFPQFNGETEAAIMGWPRRLVGQRLADLGRYHRRVKRGRDAIAVQLDAAAENGSSTGAASGSTQTRCALTPSQSATKEANVDDTPRLDRVRNLRAGSGPGA